MQSYRISKYSTAKSTPKIVWSHDYGPNLRLQLSALPLVGVLCSTLLEIKNDNNLLESFQLSPTANFDDGTYTIDHKHIITAISKSPCLGIKIFDGQKHELRRLQMRFMDDDTFESVHRDLLKSIYSLKSNTEKDRLISMSSQPYNATQKPTRPTNSSQTAPSSPGSSIFQDVSRASTYPSNSNCSQKRHMYALQLAASSPKDNLPEQSLSVKASASKINFLLPVCTFSINRLISFLLKITGGFLGISRTEFGRLDHRMPSG
ncbi:hypothetical protein NEOLI_001460 [Neolecta irregularis DAH-3]|uniref:Uncharacterized protein n=1 Tax=Neolecta irregularis (strain DAH-3) TaxID=1198029 RepID=A0A1U7LG68_NEOID|nr:hypothetical protein NEOLI_001460 [Neolecta irregularis DAH-3]|eukprot:OLL21639.1 hypothetical protein NEOLI_001460 [Neolecta irregularis DAH-3]